MSTYSIRTQTKDTPSYLTFGFYRIEKDPPAPLHYACEETKYVISGEIDILDEANGVTHNLVPGNFAFFYVGSKVQVSLVLFSRMLSKIADKAGSSRQSQVGWLSMLSRDLSRQNTRILLEEKKM